MQAPQIECSQIYTGNNKVRDNNSPESAPTGGSPFFTLSQKLERLVIRWRPLFAVYYRMFYRGMLKRELKMARLQPGASVLHIGSGPCPYTAMYLARNGLQVDAVDSHPEATLKGEALVNHYRLSHKINMLCTDGASVNGKKYDAVWVSLNVHPRDRVLENAFYCLEDGGSLIYRELPGWFSPLYRNSSSKKWGEKHSKKTSSSLLGSTSVLVKKRGKT